MAATEHSGAAIVAQICHIYAASKNGPRGRSGLTKKQLNSAENLLLLCGQHHPVIDRQWASYPAQTLKQWKATHEAKTQRGTAEAIKRAADIAKHRFFETTSDEQICVALARLRQGRFVRGSQTIEDAQRLAADVFEAQWSSGSKEVRALALAWCARILSQGTTLPQAKELLQKSRKLAFTSAATLAEAFIAAESNVGSALAILARNGTPEAKSAALRIVTNKRGTAKALAWFEQSGLRAADLDPEGKLVLLSLLIAENKWNTAHVTAGTISGGDYVECPALAGVAAVAHLLAAVPDDFKHVVATQVPFEAEQFPLLSLPEHFAQRRRARELFDQAARFSREVDAIDAANHMADYSLWLSLRDPQEHDQALRTLRDDMEDPILSLRHLNFALRFGLNVDLPSIEARVNHEVTLSENGSADAAFARLALVYTKTSPKEAAEYIDRHGVQLRAHLNALSISGLEIELLARAGLVETAKTKLQQAMQAGMGERDLGLLERIVDEAAGADPIAGRRELYESTSDLRDLTNLVDALLEAQLWQDLLPYAQKLFALIPTAESYEPLVRCLNELERTDELLISLSNNLPLVHQSSSLQLVWALTLFRSGRFAEASTEVERLGADNDSQIRSLRVQIAIGSGRWDELLAICQETWLYRDDRSAQELLKFAQISALVNGPHSQGLAIAATEKGFDDPRILASAYHLAASNGWEQSERVAGWLARAAQLSGDKGPIKSMSMQELLARKPEWDKHASFVLTQLRMGKVPEFLAGRMLNRSLLETYLLPALTNPSEMDIRKRSIVFAYSGSRHAVEHDDIKVLGLDIGAILTLSHLGLLEKTLAKYQISIPHSTLGWLFEERQRATFHQPSRIKSATEIKQLIGRRALQVIRPTKSTDHKFALEVGPELAALAASAREATAAGTRTLVVRPAPILRLGVSLGEADTSGYEDIFCSCGALVGFLKLRGVLTQAEEQKARDYLKLHERAWPAEPLIDSHTEVYLDDLAVSLLQSAGVLGKLLGSGLKASITDSEDREANALLDADVYGERQLAIIEDIRNAFETGIAAGQVRTGSWTSGENDEDDVSFKFHPTYGTIGLATSADAIVVDDRFINQHANITHGNAMSPVLSTLDVLDLLHRARELTIEEVFAHRTSLRQAGYQLIAVRLDELLHHVRHAPMAEGTLVESAELRAIRESLLRARMSAMVQFPAERAFIDQTIDACVSVLREVWTFREDLGVAAARANYVLSIADVRLWASAVPEHAASAFVSSAYAIFALKLCILPTDLTPEASAAYSKWIAEEILQPMKDYQPAIYRIVVTHTRGAVVEFAEASARKSDLAVSLEIRRAAFFLRGVDALPVMIRDELLADRELRKAFSVEVDETISFGSVASFNRSYLLRAMNRAIVKRSGNNELTDSSGNSWQIRPDIDAENPTLTITAGEKKLIASDLLLRSANKKIRRMYVNKQAERLNLTSIRRKYWLDIIERPLADVTYEELVTELSTTPVAVAAAVRQSITWSTINLEMLIPSSTAYYERLVGALKGQRNIATYSQEVAPEHIQMLRAWRSAEGLQQVLVMGSHPLIAREIANVITTREFPKISDWALGADAITRGVVLEAALQLTRVNKRSALSICTLAKRMAGDGERDRYDAFELLSAAFLMVDGELAKRRLFSHSPPFWRRLASFAHAAVIARAVIAARMDRSAFITWMRKIRSLEWYMQTLVDLRDEPRWLPDFALPSQLKNEIGGRVYAAAMSHKKSVTKLKLERVLLSEEAPSLRSQLSLAAISLPGPLEGNSEANQMDFEVAELIRADLRASVPKLASFSRLVMMAPFSAIPDDIATLCADAIRRAEYRLDSGGSSGSFDSYLIALAHVAATTRSTMLADELLVLVRSYRTFLPGELGMELALKISMIASASRHDQLEWSRCVGRAISDLSFGDLTPEGAHHLLQCVVVLCELAPELWQTCAQSIAALEAVSSRAT